MQATTHADPAWAAPAAAAPVRATVRLPGSKSITNRALIIAALASTPTTIAGPLQARDTDLMAAAVTALGAAVEPADEDQDGNEAAGASRSGSAQPAWTVTPGWTAGPARVDVGNAGTVLRFVPPAAALVTGGRRVQRRPARRRSGRSASCWPGSARRAWRSATAAGARCRSWCGAAARRARRPR